MKHVIIKGTAFFCGPKRAQLLSERGIPVVLTKDNTWAAPVSEKLVAALNEISNDVIYTLYN